MDRVYVNREEKPIRAGFGDRSGQRPRFKVRPVPPNRPGRVRRFLPVILLGIALILVATVLTCQTFKPEAPPVAGSPQPTPLAAPVAEKTSPVDLFDPAKVPDDLRDLASLAQKWGIEDDAARTHFETQSSVDEREALKSNLKTRVKQVSNWLNSFDANAPLPLEAKRYAFMMQASEEMGLWPDQAH